MADKRVAVDILHCVSQVESDADPARNDGDLELTHRVWVAAHGTTVIEVAAMTVTGRMTVLGTLTVNVPSYALDFDVELPKSNA